PAAQRVGARASAGLRRAPDSDRAAADRDPAARADDDRRTTHRDSNDPGPDDRGPKYDGHGASAWTPARTGDAAE
ncbi:hypothetical protein, partial [Mycolicibacterium hodleri]|uniref:hypothetical protein n=1 Tax=Mycolicibacterium hodleri TaxID=49897 RepID=UPI00163C7C4A